MKPRGWRLYASEARAPFEGLEDGVFELYWVDLTTTLSPHSAPNLTERNMLEKLFVLKSPNTLRTEVMAGIATSTMAYYCRTAIPTEGTGMDLALFHGNNRPVIAHWIMGLARIIGTSTRMGLNVLLSV